VLLVGNAVKVMHSRLVFGVLTKDTHDARRKDAEGFTQPGSQRYHIDVLLIRSCKYVRRRVSSSAA
jgi:hypothetical protein